MRESGGYTGVNASSECVCGYREKEPEAASGRRVGACTGVHWCAQGVEIQ